MASVNLNQLSAGQNMTTIETDTITIKGHFVRWGDVVLQTENISAVTVSNVPVPPNPITAFSALIGVVLVLGGLLAFPMSAVMRDSDFATVGLVLLLIGAAPVYYAYNAARKVNPKKALNLHMNSGNVYSIAFKHTDFMEEVLTVFAEIFEEKAGDVNIDVKNSHITGAVYSTGSTVNANG